MLKLHTQNSTTVHVTDVLLVWKVCSQFDGLSFSGGNVLLSLHRWTICSVVEQPEYGYPAVVLRCNHRGRCKTTMTRRSICFGSNNKCCCWCSWKKALKGKAGIKRSTFQ